MIIKNICIVGSGYVGLTLGLAFASRNMHVTLVDSDSFIIDGLKRGFSHVREPGIDGLLGRLVKQERLVFKTSAEFEHVNTNFDVFVIAVGTPLINGVLDKSSLEGATSLVAGKLQNGNLVVVRSTVPIGMSRFLVFSELKKVAPKALFATCPERTAEGVALREIHEIPQIIGGLDFSGTEAATELFAAICDEVIEVASPEAAELAKLASNTYRDLVFGFANDLARVAGAYEINLGEVVEACNFRYPRANIPQPGPVGGPCLSKDSWILLHSASDKDLEIFTPLAARRSNENLVTNFTNIVLEREYISPTKIGMLGLSFKGSPATADFRHSPAQELLPFLKHRFPKVDVCGFESGGNLNLVEIVQFNDFESVLSSTDLVFILTNDRKFISIESSINRLVKPNGIVIDFWRTQRRSDLRGDIRYFQWGSL